MANKRISKVSAQERERRRRLARSGAGEHPPRPPIAATPPQTSPRRAAAMACGWCSGPITVRARGPIPKWCSSACRHRAWDQRRAAASGLAAVRVLERVVTQPRAADPRSPQHGEWPDVLADLATQLDRGLVYDRELAALLPAVNGLSASLERRLRHR